MPINQQEILTLLKKPFNDLLFEAALCHRANWNHLQIQASTLLSIKTGKCPEDCKYCPQSAHHKSPSGTEPLLEIEKILEAARIAKAQGATRFCMGAAWRNLNDRDLPKIVQMIKEVKDLGLETCITLGMITASQASILKDAGLDYYNHNLDSSAEFYPKIITTRTYQDRLNTLALVKNAGINVCCGGIIGMGEGLEDRAALLAELANLNPAPQSVPINMLIKAEGTPLAKIDNNEEYLVLDLIRMIAAARIAMPKSYVRLSAGREQMNKEAQTLAFFAGANSIFYGEKLLTAANPSLDEDSKLFEYLGLNIEKS